MSPSVPRPVPPRLAEADRPTVVQDHAGLVRALREAIPTGRSVTVMVDERRAERRRRVQPVREERRQRDRRSLPVLRSNSGSGQTGGLSAQPPLQQRAQTDAGWEEMRMKRFLIASGVTLAVGIGLVCMIVTRRDTCKRGG